MIIVVILFIGLTLVRCQPNHQYDDPPLIDTMNAVCTDTLNQL